MSDSCLSYILDNLRHTFFHKDKLKLEQLQAQCLFSCQKNNHYFVVFSPLLVLFHSQGIRFLFRSRNLYNIYILSSLLKTCNSASLQNMGQIFPLGLSANSAMNYYSEQLLSNGALCCTHRVQF